MVTLGQMIDETHGLLQSWSLDSEQVTTLAAPLGPTDVTGSVTAARGIATGISPGICEAGLEMFYVDSITQTGGFTVPAWGRGYLGTSAAQHQTGDRVISQPTFPRFWTREALNETMNRIFPDVFAVKQVELTTTAPRVTYQLPSDAQWVLGAKWQVPDGRQYWDTIRRWRVSPGGGTQFGDTGITVDVGDQMVPGRPIQFLYAAEPKPFVNETDDFVGVTGLPASLRDVVILGAASAMTMSQELSRLQLASIEQQDRSREVAPSAGLTSSQALERKFQTRLMEERKTLQRLYPPRITGSWL